MENRFARVVFGVTSSPFLLNGTLLKYITSHERKDPEFVNQMHRSFYVDDLSVSLEDVDKAYQLYLKSRDRPTQSPYWRRSSKKESQRELSFRTEEGNRLDEDYETYSLIMAGGLEGRDVNTEKKVLGTNWNYVTDEFLFKFQTNVEGAQGLIPTKRNVLRVIASFYDTMSSISPIIAQMKIPLQDICKADYHWDSELDSELKTR